MNLRNLFAVLAFYFNFNKQEGKRIMFKNVIKYSFSILLVFICNFIINKFSFSPVICYGLGIGTADLIIMFFMWLDKASK